MKCPECGNKFPLQGNSKEVLGVMALECPNCHTRFEIKALQKMFPKGLLVLLVASLPLSFLPAAIGVPLLAVVTAFLVRWTFKPENVVARNASNT